ncbi:MAG: peptidase M14 [bacterium]|nr:peptidase M14 [bacterium]
MRRAFVLVCCLSLWLPAAAAAEVPEGWLTPAEKAGFASTPSYGETMSFLQRLQRKAPDVLTLNGFGRSAEGRPLPLVIAARGGTTTPEQAAGGRRAVVLVQNGIHAGEIDGKDASLIFLRDLALGRHRELLDRLVLLFVPIYNVDGHERVSPYNRPNQDGPVEGMGFRTTTDGHDLNRDHLKLSTPEARAVVGLFNTWRPHLHVDNHVTDGSDHDWVLTYSWAEAPQLAEPLDHWIRIHMPRVLEDTERAGHRVGPYVSLVDRNDPSKGFSTYVGPPRYATGYYPLRHCPSILVENHAYKPYEARVRANHDFMLALFERTAAAAEELRAAVAQSQRNTASLGMAEAPPSDVVIRFKTEEAQDKVRFPVYEWTAEPSEVFGTPVLRYRQVRVREIEVPWAHRPVVDVAAPRPRGYLVAPGWPAIERRLAGHDLLVEVLDSAVELDVETLRISNPRQDDRSKPSYQGLTQIEVDVARAVERRTIPAGTLWIPADQIDFEVAVQLLEPEATDSLVRWGLLSSVLERKEYIEGRVLEDLARQMLENEALAREWAAALADEAFASNPWERYFWWYRRTPYWDDTVGLMPVMRLMQPAGLTTSRWKGTVAR